MDWIITNSSTMSKFKYDEKNQVLTIAFTSGHIYHYFRVPLSIFEGLKNASSKGSFFNSRIKGCFDYRE